MELKDRICSYLRTYHVGSRKAVHSEELEKLFDIHGRTVRHAVSELRKQGYPICSDCHGYYYADNQREINRCVHRLTEFAAGVADTRTAMMFTEPDNKGLKIELTIHVTGDGAYGRI